MFKYIFFLAYLVTFALAYFGSDFGYRVFEFWVAMNAIVILISLALVVPVFAFFKDDLINNLKENKAENKSYSLFPPIVQLIVLYGSVSCGFIPTVIYSLMFNAIVTGKQTI